MSFSIGVNYCPPTHIESSVITVREQFEDILKEVPSNHFFSVDNMRKFLTKYSEKELQLIYNDFCELKEKTFSEATKSREYLVTAGGPASGKSTLQEAFIAKSEKIKYAYIDPDRSCLLHMRNTYKADIESQIRDPQSAYIHWREASNFLSNVYLALALKEGYAVAHGSTMASPYAKSALLAVHNTYGYTTTVFHVTCNEEIRAESKKQREESGIVQCTETDFIDKQNLFLKLLGDYCSGADQIVFYLRDKMDHVTLAAKKQGTSYSIIDSEAEKEISNTHDTYNGNGFWSTHLSA